jgi:cobalt-zinc-cadmium efflux system outer membrane protein
MKIILLIVLGYFLIVIQAEASCTINTPNDVLTLIKANHPRIMINTSKGIALEKGIEVANQVPNLELDSESLRGSSIEGDVFSASVSIKHTFELGGKRNSRVNVAKMKFQEGMELVKYDNEHTLIEIVIKLHRLRQVYSLIPLYQETLQSFNKILRSIKRRKSLSPEQIVERETLELASNDYKLKISRLNSEEFDLTRHLNFYTGPDCLITEKILPTKVELNEEFNISLNYRNYTKLKIAKFGLDLAKAKYKLEKSNSYPNIAIGPKYEFEKVNVNQTNTVGISLTMELPILNTNSGGRARATKEILTASQNLRNIEKESEFDLNVWRMKYKNFSDSLKTIANKEKVEKKHQKIEALFKRGVISTSLVIESHRQLIEFSNTRFEFELGVIEALWNIYKINGNIDGQTI